MQVSTNSNHGVTVRVAASGESVLESPSPWYRLFRALADLYLTGELDGESLLTEMVGWSVTADGLERDYGCPAARELNSRICLALWEPKCGCRDEDCGCPELTEDDRRARLRELI